MAEIRFTGTEIGFGSPSFSGATPARDAGFGAPWPLSVNTNDYINIAETGHGDPFLKVSVSIDTPTGTPAYKKLADNGGELIRIAGDFTTIRDLFERVGGDVVPDNPLGPFQLKFVKLDADNNPTSTVYLGQSAIPNLRTQLFTNAQQDEMLVSTPVMPKGNYRLQLQPMLNGNGVYRPVDLEDFEVITRLRYDKTMSLRHNLPSFWAAGQRTDSYDASNGYIKGQDTNYSYLLQSTGEALQNLYNNAYTIVTQDYNKGDNRFYIETSLGLNPLGGRIIIGHGEYEYDAVGRLPDDPNVHFLTGLKKLVRNSGKGPRQHDIENPKIYAGDDQFPPHDDATLTDSIENPIIYKGTRVHTDHYDFSVIENFYKLLNTGFVKPDLIDQTQWERAYNRVEYGERELMRVIFEYFYELFKKLNRPVRLKTGDVEFRVFQNELGAPDRYVVGSDFLDDTHRPNVGVIYDYGNNSLNCSHVQRLVRINKEFYFIKNRFIDNPGAGNYQIDHYGSTYWNGMSEDKANELAALPIGDVQIEILPWIIFQDNGGKFHIRFERTCFRNIDSFIDVDFIDLDLFISGLNGEEEAGSESNRNFNFMDMCAANIDDKIYLHQRCNSVFGTYFRPDAAPTADIFVNPVRNLI